MKITRSEAIGHLKNIAIYSVQDGYTDEARQALDMAIKALEETVRKKGKWIKVGDCSWKCNKCGEISCCSANFCPDCGTDMRGEENG